MDSPPGEVEFCDVLQADDIAFDIMNMLTILTSVTPLRGVMKTKKIYKTDAICHLFDISKATLFRWEREGLISPVGRDWRNWRRYSDQNLKEIRRIINNKVSA